MHVTLRPKRKSRFLTLKYFTVILLVLALACVALYYAFVYPRMIDEATYPLLYTEEISAYASEYGLEPARVAAVIFCESSFRPEAVSSVGARGLMQIMPETGEWIAEKLGEQATYTHDLLFDPDLNIRYGCWFLNYLQNRFGGDLVKETAAYHAGGTRVSEWLDNEEYSPDGVTLAYIPFDSTRKYVDKVQIVLEKYKERFNP